MSFLWLLYGFGFGFICQLGYLCLTDLYFIPKRKKQQDLEYNEKETIRILESQNYDELRQWDDALEKKIGKYNRHYIDTSVLKSIRNQKTFEQECSEVKRESDRLFQKAEKENMFTTTNYIDTVREQNIQYYENIQKQQEHARMLRYQSYGHQIIRINIGKRFIWGDCL